MAFKKINVNETIRNTILVLLMLPLVANANIDCDGNAFHCVNSTHFMICVDLGSGVSRTIDNFIIACPESTECHKTNYYECEFPKATTTSDPGGSSVLGISDTTTIAEESTVITTPGLTTEVSSIETSTVSDTIKVDAQSVTNTGSLGESTISTVEVVSTTEYTDIENIMYDISTVLGENYNYKTTTDTTVSISESNNVSTIYTPIISNENSTNNIIDIVSYSTTIEYKTTTERILSDNEESLSVVVETTTEEILTEIPTTELYTETYTASNDYTTPLGNDVVGNTFAPSSHETSTSSVINVENNMDIKETTSTNSNKASYLESATEYITHVTLAEHFDPQIIDENTQSSTDNSNNYTNDIENVSMNEIHIDASTYNTVASTQAYTTTEEIVATTANSVTENETITSYETITLSPVISTSPIVLHSTTQAGISLSETTTDNVGEKIDGSVNLDLTEGTTTSNYEIQTTTPTLKVSPEGTTVETTTFSSRNENIIVDLNIVESSSQSTLTIKEENQTTKTNFETVTDTSILIDGQNQGVRISTSISQVPETVTEQEASSPFDVQTTTLWSTDTVTGSQGSSEPTIEVQPTALTPELGISTHDEYPFRVYEASTDQNIRISYSQSTPETNYSIQSEISNLDSITEKEQVFDYKGDSISSTSVTANQVTLNPNFEIQSTSDLETATEENLFSQIENTSTNVDTTLSSNPSVIEVTEQIVSTTQSPEITTDESSLPYVDEMATSSTVSILKVKLDLDTNVQSIFSEQLATPTTDPSFIEETSSSVSQSNIEANYEIKTDKSVRLLTGQSDIPDVNVSILSSASQGIQKNKNVLQTTTILESGIHEKPVFKIEETMTQNAQSNDDINRHTSPVDFGLPLMESTTFDSNALVANQVLSQSDLVNQTPITNSNTVTPGLNVSRVEDALFVTNTSTSLNDESEIDTTISLQIMTEKTHPSNTERTIIKNSIFENSHQVRQNLDDGNPTTALNVEIVTEPLYIEIPTIQTLTERYDEIQTSTNTLQPIANIPVSNDDEMSNSDSVNVKSVTETKYEIMPKEINLETNMAVAADSNVEEQTFNLSNNPVQPGAISDAHTTLASLGTKVTAGEALSNSVNQSMKSDKTAKEINYGSEMPTTSEISAGGSSAYNIEDTLISGPTHITSSSDITNQAKSFTPKERGLITPHIVKSNINEIISAVDPTQTESYNVVTSVTMETLSTSLNRNIFVSDSQPIHKLQLSIPEMNLQNDISIKSIVHVSDVKDPNFIESEYGQKTIEKPAINAQATTEKSQITMQGSVIIQNMDIAFENESSITDKATTDLPSTFSHQVQTIAPLKPSTSVDGLLSRKDTSATKQNDVVKQNIFNDSQLTNTNGTQSMINDIERNSNVNNEFSATERSLTSNQIKTEAILIPIIITNRTDTTTEIFSNTAYNRSLVKTDNSMNSRKNMYNESSLQSSVANSTINSFEGASTTKLIPRDISAKETVLFKDNIAVGHINNDHKSVNNGSENDNRQLDIANDKPIISSYMNVDRNNKKHMYEQNTKTTKGQITSETQTKYSSSQSNKSDNDLDTINTTEHTVRSSTQSSYKEDITTTPLDSEINKSRSPLPSKTTSTHEVVTELQDTRINESILTTTRPILTSAQHTDRVKTIDSSHNFSETDIRDPLHSYCRHRGRGRYSDGDDCTKFYICIGRPEPIVGKCPANTVFSDLRKQCTKNMSHCIRNNEFKCISEGRFTDIFKHNVYYICMYRINTFIRFEFKCQNGYHLDQSLVKCVIEEASDQSTSIEQSKSEASSSKSHSSKEKTKHSHNNIKEKTKVKFECENEGKFVDPNNCRKYYVCKMHKKEYRRRRKSCDSDEVFHKDKKKCVDADSHEQDFC